MLKGNEPQERRRNGLYDGEKFCRLDGFAITELSSSGLAPRRAPVGPSAVGDLVTINPKAAVDVAGHVPLDSWVASGIAFDVTLGWARTYDEAAERGIGAVTLPRDPSDRAQTDTSLVAGDGPAPVPEEIDLSNVGLTAGSLSEPRLRFGVRAEHDVSELYASLR